MADLGADLTRSIEAIDRFRAAVARCCVDSDEGCCDETEESLARLVDTLRVVESKLTGELLERLYER